MLQYPYLCGFRDVLHPLNLLLLAVCGHQERLLPVVDVEAVLSAHPRLGVQDGEVLDLQLTVDAEVERGIGGTVGVKQQIRELEEEEEQSFYLKFSITKKHDLDVLYS